MTPKYKEPNQKQIIWISLQFKTDASKNMIKNVRRQPKEWEEILADYISDKGLASKIFKELLQLKIKKTNNPVKKK